MWSFLLGMRPTSVGKIPWRVCLEAETQVWGSTAQPRTRRGICWLQWRGLWGGWAVEMTESWLCPVRCIRPATSQTLSKVTNLTQYLADKEFSGNSEDSAPNVHLGLGQRHREPWGSKLPGIHRNLKAGSGLWQSINLRGCQHKVFLSLWRVGRPQSHLFTLVVIVRWR